MGDLILAPTIDYDEIAKRVWERSIPAVPASGAFEEKFKQMVIAYELGEGGVTQGTTAAGTWAVIDVIPPAGEYWLFSGFCYQGGGTSTDEAHVNYYDSVDAIEVGSGRVRAWPNAFAGQFLISNTNYAKFAMRNTGAAGALHRYGYAALKVKSSSIKVSKLKPTAYLLNSLTKRKNPHPEGPVLPDYLKPLEGRAFYDFRGKVCVYLEKDVPLKLDEKGNVVERKHAYFDVEDFEKLFSDIILDETKRPIMRFIKEKDADGRMGWLKYMEKFEGEGIEF